MSEKDRFLTYVTSSEDDFENYGRLFITLPKTTEFVELIDETGAWVVRARDAGTLPKHYSGVMVEIEGECWWDSPQAEYAMDDEERIDFMDELDSEVVEEGVTLVSHADMVRAFRGERFAGTMKFYIDGNRCTIYGVTPWYSYCMSTLISREQFAQALTAKLSTEELVKAGVL